MVIRKRITISNPPNRPAISLKDTDGVKPLYAGDFCNVFKVAKGDQQYAVKVIDGDKF
jgi:hypothetical protein